MPKKNANAGSKGVWASLSKPQTTIEPEQKPELKAVQQPEQNKSRNLDLNKECKKPKRYSRKNGEEFTIGKGIVLTKEANRKLNMVKALSENITYNEIVDEALHEYFDKNRIK